MHRTFPTCVGFEKAPWSKGRLIGQKGPIKPKDVWAIRAQLPLERGKRDLALFNLAIDSKLRGCDLVALQVEDVCVGGGVRDRSAYGAHSMRRTKALSKNRQPASGPAVAGAYKAGEHRSLSRDRGR